MMNSRERLKVARERAGFATAADALLVKRIGRAARSGFVLIISDNRNVPAVERAGQDVEVVGKVVWAGVKV